MKQKAAAFLPPVLLLAAWQLGATSGLIPTQVLPEPLDVARSGIDLWNSGELTTHLTVSLSRLVSGYALGATIGLAFGTAIGLSSQARQLFAPLFMALRQIPVLAFMPLLVLLLGIEEPFKIAIVAITSFFPVALASFDAVRDVPQSWFDIARIYRTPVVPFVLRILGPGTAPAILTGLRIALTRAWLVLVAAELLAADSGVGQMMEMGRQLFQLDVVLVGVVFSGLIGFTLDFAMRRIEARLLRWRPA